MAEPAARLPEETAAKAKKGLDLIMDLLSSISRELVDEVSSAKQEQIRTIFTKILPTKTFQGLRDKILFYYKQSGI